MIRWLGLLLPYRRCQFSSPAFAPLPCPVPPSPIPISTALPPTPAPLPLPAFPSLPRSPPPCRLPLSSPPPPQVISGQDCPALYVRNILEKTGGMPLYIEALMDCLAVSSRDGAGGMSGDKTLQEVLGNLDFQLVRGVVWEGAGKRACKGVDGIFRAAEVCDVLMTRQSQAAGPGTSRFHLSAPTHPPSHLPPHCLRSPHLCGRRSSSSAWTACPPASRCASRSRQSWARWWT